MNACVQVKGSRRDRVLLIASCKRHPIIVHLLYAKSWDGCADLGLNPTSLVGWVSLVASALKSSAKTYLKRMGLAEQ